MSPYRPPRLSEQIRALANARRFPGPEAYGADRAIMDLVETYQALYAESVGAKRSRTLDHVPHLDQHRYVADACLHDSAATAALIKELLFLPVAPNADGSFGAADLGTGTGVLALGATIAGLRAGAERVTVYASDIHPHLLMRASQALSHVGNRVRFEMLRGDIRDPAFLSLIPASDVRLWVSETINGATPRLDITEDDVVAAEQGYVFAPDPYPQVLRALARAVPGFVQSIREKRSHLFPDAINGDYLPDARGGKLRLATSISHAEHGPLGTIGRDFRKLAKAGRSRW